MIRIFRLTREVKNALINALDSVPARFYSLDGRLERTHDVPFPPPKYYAVAVMPTASALVIDSNNYPTFTMIERVTYARSKWVEPTVSATEDGYRVNPGYAHYRRLA